MASVWLVELLWVCWVCSGYLVGFILFYFILFIYFFNFGFLVLVSGVWVEFGWRLGGVWVGVGWLDLGLVVVIFSDGLGDLFRWVCWWVSMFVGFVWAKGSGGVVVVVCLVMAGARG